MPYLLVDARDDRILAACDSLETAMRALLDPEDGSDESELCVVYVQASPGAVIGTESSITLRQLS